MHNNKLVILCTCPDRDTAAEIARVLVDEGLAGCVNIVPGMLSIYRWQGRVETDEELLLIIKTTTERYEALEKRLRVAHPYEVPEILALPVARGLPDYLEWLEQACRRH